VEKDGKHRRKRMHFERAGYLKGGGNQEGTLDADDLDKKKKGAGGKPRKKVGVLCSPEEIGENLKKKKGRSLGEAVQS